jgi:hypothetical protein
MIRTTAGGGSKARLIDENEYDCVVDLFLTTHDNRTTVIAKKLKLRVDVVSLILDEYLSRRRVGYFQIKDMSIYDN